MCDQMYVNYGFQNKTERVQAKKKTHFKPMTKLENIAVIIDNPMVDNFANYGNLVHCWHRVRPILSKRPANVQVI